MNVMVVSTVVGAVSVMMRNKVTKYYDMRMQAWLEKHAKELRGSHFINVRIRINGEWREYEADWLRGLAWELND